MSDQYLLENHNLRLLAQAYERLGDAVTISDTDGKLVYVNSACEKLYGYSREELLGQSFPLIAPSGQFVVTTEMVEAIPEERSGVICR